MNKTGKTAPPSQTRPSKTEIRQALAQQVSAFIDAGGQIEQLEQGDSGLVDGQYQRNSFVFGQPKQTRTPIPEVAAAVDTRRHCRREHSNLTFSQHPVKRIIYDDFGEPIREVWEKPTR